MEFIKTLGILMVISVIASIPSQFSIVQTLKKNGQDASMFLFLFSDVRKFKNLMKKEYDESNKFLMKITYYGYIIPSTVSVLSFISIVLIIIFK
jgi:hypothetical protein